MSPPTLDAIVLKASQVGPGYALSQRPDGRGVAGYVTLDLCGASFPSEALRTARLQVNYVHSPRLASVAAVSNEVVSYAPGGTQQALGEVATAANKCPRTPVTGPVVGEVQVTYRLRRVTDPQLAAGYLAFEVHVSRPVAGRQRTATVFVVYQARGNLLSGVYATAGSDVAATRSIALHAAEQAAHNLAAA